MIDTYLRTHFEDPTALEVLWILCEAFPKEGRTIKFCHSSRVYLITDLLTKYTESEIDCAASLIGPLSFIGGPPEAHGAYVGSLLTVLFDQILLAWHLRGEYVDLVERLPETV